MRTAVELRSASDILRRLLEFDPDQARDESGRWSPEEHYHMAGKYRKDADDARARGDTKGAKDADRAAKFHDKEGTEKGNRGVPSQYDATGKPLLPHLKTSEAERPIPKGVDFDKCVDRMGRSGQVDDPAALCAWMWDEGTGFFATGEACGGECENCEAKAAGLKHFGKAEAVGSSSQGQLLRPGSRRKVESLASLAEAVVDRKTRSVRCTVISEGGGNRRDRHWYGPEAIEDVARLINGSKAHINHPTEAEARSRPEGDVWGLAGFWKDGEIVEANGRKAVVATLVCDTSEAGEAALSKAEHAIEYAKQFPGLAEVYAGISINGDGDTESRTIEGEDWNYVVHVTELPRADVVTRPAREGQFLQLVESIRNSNPEEALAMANKAVKAELTKVAEAVTALDEGKDPKSNVGIIEAALAKVKALFTEAFPPKKEDESETEDEAEAKAKAAGKKGAESEEENEDEAGKKSEDEAMRAAGYEDDMPGDEDDDEEEPADGKKGGHTTVHIKHEEKMTKSESAAMIRDLSKQLKESKAREAALSKKVAESDVRAMVESGVPEDFAKALMDLPPAHRKAMRAMAGMIEANGGGFTGTTTRGTGVKEAKPGDGFLKLIETSGRS